MMSHLLLATAFVNVLSESNVSIVALSVDERHEDGKDSEKRVCLVLLSCCLTMLRPRKTLFDLKVVKSALRRAR